MAAKENNEGIPRLEIGNNFHNWKDRLELLMEENGLSHMNELEEGDNEERREDFSPKFDKLNDNECGPRACWISCCSKGLSAQKKRGDQTSWKVNPNEKGLVCWPCLNVSTALVLWTQRRHQKTCPPAKFHRDIEFPNFDAYRKDDYTDVRKTTWGSGDSKPGSTYVVSFFGWLCGAYSAKTFVHELVTYMSAPADVLALASIEVDISKVAPGGCMSYKWRGKPLFIKNRTEADIELEAKTPLTALRHPETEEQRCVKPEWLVVVGICTHLGCVPIPNSGDWAGGFYCPCHGSHYDNIGRARKGPAPLNLEVPPYKFVSDTTIVVG